MGSCLGIPREEHPPITQDLSISSHGRQPSGTDSFSTDGRFSKSFDMLTPGESAEELFSTGWILPAPKLRIYTYAELKNATRNFKPETMLGEGGFGRVFKGWVDEKTLNPSRIGHGMVVAVKKLNPESLQGLEEWQSEINFLGRLSHPNLVKLLGYCWEETELLLVYEFMQKGSLENHLFRKGSGCEPLPWALRLSITIGAARGLAFLHDSQKHIIYRDFKASNILLDSNYNAKLSDFGLAKHGPTGSNSHITTRVVGTYGYAAPEYMATGHLYVKSDVYGFGVVLLEMLSGLRAVDPNRPSGRHNLVEYAKSLLTDRRKLAQLMDRRLEGQYPLKAASKATQLALKCLATDPKNRPSMNEVVENLEHIASISAKTDTTKPSAPRSLPHNHDQVPQYRSPIHRKNDRIGQNLHAFIPRSNK